MSKLYLEDSLVQCKSAESLQSVFSGASCFSASQSQPLHVLYSQTAKDVSQKSSGDVLVVNIRFDKMNSQNLCRILFLRGNLINECQFV